MTWEEALAWLESLGQFGSRPGLERIERVLAELGNPQHDLRIVHVAGTNGKGSVCAFLSSILTAAGYRTGLYTSPHLSRYNERFRINGQQITNDELAMWLGVVKDQIDALAKTASELFLTEFEALTVVAFLYFRSLQIDYLVLEVGLGGRLDATNVVRPEVTIITRVGLDHTGVLGNTMSDIAREKAGIIKPGVPVVVGKQTSIAAETIWRVARSNGADICEVANLVGIESKVATIEGQVFDLIYGGKTLCDVNISLLGAHQLENLAIAVAGIGVLRQNGLEISEEEFRAGLAHTVWPARFEVVQKEPLVIIDGAHNQDGARSVVKAAGEYLPNRCIHLIIGLLADKDVDAILRTLAPLACVATATRPDSPRAQEPAEIGSKLRCLGLKASIVDDIWEAITQAMVAVEPDGVVLIVGSLYLAGRAREYFLGEDVFGRRL